MVADHVAKTIPLQELKELENAGVTFDVTRGDITTEWPALASQQPRGYGASQVWTGRPGTYRASSKQVIIATQDGPDGTRVMPGSDTSTSADVLAHETGHALNYLPLSGHVSDSEAFKAAYLGPMSGRLSDDPYYHQQDTASGRDEAFAESHAMFLTTPAELKAESPTLYAYWQDRLAH